MILNRCRVLLAGACVLVMLVSMLGIVSMTYRITELKRAVDHLSDIALENEKTIASCIRDKK